MRILDALEKKGDDYLQDSLKEFRAVMDKEEEIVILYGQEADLEDFEATVTRSIKEARIEVTDEEQAAVIDNVWQKFCDELSLQCNDILYVRYLKDDSIINLVALDKDFDMAMEEVQKHIRNHALKSISVDLGRANNKLIERWMKREQQKIEKDFARYNIKIEPCDDSGFNIFGLEGGLGPAKSRLENLKRDIIKDKHTITTPGMPNYFTQQETGKFFLQGQEQKYQVVIQYEDINKAKDKPAAKVEQKPLQMAITETGTSRTSKWNSDKSHGGGYG